MGDRFWYKSSCDTCRRVRSVLRDLGADLEERDYTKHPLNEADVEALLDVVGSVTGALNVYNKTVRAEGWKIDPPARADFVKRAAADNNLIRRPVLQAGVQVIVGRDEDAYQAIYG